MNTEIDKKIEIFKDNPKRLPLEDITEVFEHFQSQINETSESLKLANKEKDLAEKKKIEAEEKEKQATEKYRKAQKLQEEQYGEVIKELFEDPKNSLEASTRKESKKAIYWTLGVAIITIIISTFIPQLFQKPKNVQSSNNIEKSIGSLEAKIQRLINSNEIIIAANSQSKVQSSETAVMPSKKTWQESVTKMEFVWVPKGSFDMGSDSGDDDEKPVHRVNVDGFWMAKYEVTNEQYRKYKSDHNSWFYNDDKQPVTQVSWNDAKEFVKWLSNQSNGKYEFRLPTEAQWEYACRAGTSTQYYTGDTENDLDRAGWYKKNSGRQTHAVGEKEPNSFGLYDMHGNVWEWCEDRYENYTNKRVTNPVGPGSGSSRVLRGGSWFYTRYCRSAGRGRYEPGGRYGDVGFRVLRSLPL